MMELIVSDLARSGLVPEDMRVALEGNFGYRIPYFLPTGEVHPHMFRIRRFEPAEDGSKYTQAAGVAPYPYFVPGADWRGAHERVKHWIIEGEKKAAAAWKFLKMTAIGIGGCHNWKGPKNARVHRTVSPHILEAIPEGATVEIIFDGDYRTNSQVQHGLAELCLALRDAGRIPVVVTLPEGRDKVGFDDWLVATNGAGFDKLPRHNGHDLWDGVASLAYRSGARTQGQFDRIIPNAENAARIMQVHDWFKDNVWYDAFMQKPVIDNKPMEDGDAIRILGKFQHEVEPSFKRGTIEDALLKVFQNPRFRRNPLVEYLEDIKWDGEKRVETFFENYCNSAEDKEYLRAVSKNWLVSLVARALRPGCKADNMLILEGGQGIGKSRALRAIGGDYYRESTVHDVGSKDFLQNMAGAWIYDINELRAMRKSDHATIKSLLSSSEDTFRLPYGRLSVTQKRQCVIVGTTNEDTYLTDETGGRRFWPVRCGYLVEVDLIEQNRDQILAEAVQMFRDGYEWWEMPGAKAELVVRARNTLSPFAETVQRATRDLRTLPRYKSLTAGSKVDYETYAYVTVDYVYAYMQLDNSHKNHQRSMQISAALKAAGLEKVRVWNDTLGETPGPGQTTIFRRKLGPWPEISLNPDPPMKGSKLS
jgi:hypothetical protein